MSGAPSAKRRRLSTEAILAYAVDHPNDVAHSLLVHLCTPNLALQLMNDERTTDINRLTTIEHTPHWRAMGDVNALRAIVMKSNVPLMCYILGREDINLNIRYKCPQRNAYKCIVDILLHGTPVGYFGGKVISGVRHRHQLAILKMLMKDERLQMFNQPTFVISWRDTNVDDSAERKESKLVQTVAFVRELLKCERLDCHYLKFTRLNPYLD